MYGGELKMRKTLILLSLLLFACAYSSVDFEIQQRALIPSIQSPGDEVVLKIAVVNTGNEDLEKVNVSILLPESFSLSYGKESEVVDSICVSCSHEIEYRIHIPENIKEGIYYAEVRGYAEGVVKKLKIPLNVIGRSEIDVSIETDTLIYAGKRFNASIQVCNKGFGGAGNIIVSFLPSEIAVISPRKISISRLDAGACRKFAGSIYISESFEQDVARIPVEISFKTSNGSVVSRSDYISIEVGDKASLSISSVKHDNFEIGKEGKIYVRVENGKSGDARDVVVEISSNSFSGDKKVFLGTIERDSEALAIFSVTPTSYGEKKVKVRIYYRDDYGEHVLEENFTVYVSPANTTVLSIVFIIALAVVAFIILKKKGIV